MIIENIKKTNFALSIIVSVVLSTNYSHQVSEGGLEAKGTSYKRIYAYTNYRFTGLLQRFTEYDYY